MVQAKEKTVEELLLNFDLGCCRAAFDTHLNIWVSIQCLSSIFIHKYPMPKYMKDENDFVSTLKNFRDPNKEIHGAEKMMYQRFLQRIQKYSDRGFGVKWIKTVQILPWIKNRFHYAEWKNEVSNEKSQEINIKMSIILTVIELFYNRTSNIKKGLVLNEIKKGFTMESFDLIMKQFEKDSDEMLMNKASREICNAIIIRYKRCGLTNEFFQNGIIELFEMMPEFQIIKKDCPDIFNTIYQNS